MFIYRSRHSASTLNVRFSHPYCFGTHEIQCNLSPLSRSVIKAEAAGLTLQGSVAASDAFFPFRDGLDVLARAGATAVIQPGGSMRDDEVIAAADEHGIAMVLTGVRHFRH